MDSAKVSFSINEKEGLDDLRRRQREAGATSLGLYVKQLVTEHLARNDEQKLDQLSDSVEHNTEVLLELARLLTGTIQRLDEPKSANIEDGFSQLRSDLSFIFASMLQASRPLSAEQADTIVTELLQGDR